MHPCAPKSFDDLYFRGIFCRVSQSVVAKELKLWLAGSKPWAFKQ